MTQRRRSMAAMLSLLSLLAASCTPLEKRLLSADEDDRRKALEELLTLSEVKKDALVPKLAVGLGLRRDVLGGHQQQMISDLKQVKTEEDLTGAFANLAGDLAQGSAVRARALEALVLIGASAAPVLGEVVADTRELKFVRTDVAKALAKMGPHAEQAKEHLRRAVAGNDKSVALYAAIALGELGESDAGVVRALETGLTFADEAPRQDAAAALRKLGKDPAAARRP